MFINAVYHIIWQCDAHLIPLADVTLKAGIALNHTMKKINTYPKLFMSVCMSSVELGIGLLMKWMFFGNHSVINESMNSSWRLEKVWLSVSW